MALRSFAPEQVGNIGEIVKKGVEHGAPPPGVLKRQVRESGEARRSSVGARQVSARQVEAWRTGWRERFARVALQNLNGLDLRVGSPRLPHVTVSAQRLTTGDRTCSDRSGSGQIPIQAQARQCQVVI